MHAENVDHLKSFSCSSCARKFLSLAIQVVRHTFYCLSVQLLLLILTIIICLQSYLIAFACSRFVNNLPDKNHSLGVCTEQLMCAITA